MCVGEIFQADAATCFTRHKEEGEDGITKMVTVESAIETLCSLGSRSGVGVDLSSHSSCGPLLGLSRGGQLHKAQGVQEVPSGPVYRPEA